MLGETVGSYRIVDKVGVGGAGTVYRAEHTLIGKPAAVKVLHPQHSTREDQVTRFFNEAKLTSAIKHPGIVEVFDFGFLASGHAYIVMELLEGMALAQHILARAPLPEPEAVLLVRNVCGGLAAAHAKNIVHRDLKPDNIFLISDPDSPIGVRTKILDFGIAKLTSIGLANTMTLTGAVLGTPSYMSPEQCRGLGEVDHRSDLYSLACILYELVTGRPPFTEAGLGELIAAHLFVEPEPPSRHVAGLSSELDDLVMTLLAKSPDQRLSSTAAVQQRLTSIAHDAGWLASDDLGASRPSRPLAAPRSSSIAAASPDAAAPADPKSSPSRRRGIKSTTLSGAASELTQPGDRPRRRSRWLGMTAAALIGAALLVVIATSSTDDLSVPRDASDPAAPASPAGLRRPIAPAAAPRAAPEPAAEVPPPAIVDPPAAAAPPVTPAAQVPPPAIVDPPVTPAAAPPPAIVDPPATPAAATPRHRTPPKKHKKQLVNAPSPPPPDPPATEPAIRRDPQRDDADLLERELE